MGKGNKRTIYLGLDYTNFTGGVTEVNRKMQLLDAEFKRAQQEAQNYGNETDKLGLKQDYLKQKIALQTQKVEAAEKAYKEATETNKKSQREIDALAKKVIQEKTAFEKLTGQLKETEVAQEKVNDSTVSFGDKIREMAASLGVDVNPQIEAFASKFDNVNEKTGKTVLAIGAIATAAAALVGPLIKCTNEASEYAKELQVLSQITNVSTDELQKLKYAGEQVGVSMDSISDALKEITNKMYEASTGSEELESLFRKLRVSIEDNQGQLRSANAVFYDTVDALGKIQNETRRDAVAMQLFGESARNLNPLIEIGSKGIKELGLEAEDMGMILSGVAIKDLVAYNKSMEKFNNTSEQARIQLGLVLLPILTTVADTISSIPAPTMKAIMAFTAVATVVGVLGKALTGIAVPMTLFNANLAGTAVVGTKTMAIILGIAAALVLVASVIAYLIGKSNGFNEAMEKTAKTVGNVSQSVTNAQNTTYSAQQHASGTTNFRGGRTWVGEAGPELVELPPGSRITPKAQAGTTEYNTFYITIDAKNVDDFNKVVALAKNQRIAQRRMA